MSQDMKRKFNFVYIAGNAFTEIPHSTLHTPHHRTGRVEAFLAGTGVTTTTTREFCTVGPLVMTPHEMVDPRWF